MRVPNGVDLRSFSGSGPLPDDLASIPRPWIGYAGYIKDQLDWRLLTDVAAARPDWSLVLAGMDKVRDPDNRRLLDQLSARSNVYLLGSKTTEQLALYPRQFDVCIMPYIHNDYTRYIYPLKLHEYLATGRPVVGTPIDALLEYQHLLSLAGSSSEWISAIERALAGGAPASAEARIATASRHDWSILTRHVAETIATRLGVADRLPGESEPVKIVA
jgi:glycosyltransferase involved in cell wall biosynthesis